MVDIQFPADVFENGVVARGIRNRQMQRSQTRTVGHLIRNHLEPALRNCRYRFVHRREIIEHILYPCGNREPRLLTVPFRVFRLGQPQQIGHQSFLIHAVGTANLVSGSNYTPVFRGPMYRIVPRFPAPGHAPRKNPQVRVRVLLPVHRPGSHHRAIQTIVYHPRTGVCPGQSGNRQDQRQTKCNFIRSHISFFCNLGLLYRKVRTKKRQQLPYKRLYRTAFPEICINMRKFAVATCSAFR